MGKAVTDEKHVAVEDDRDERHPNGTPRTIHHYDDKTRKPVYHDEVVDLTDEEAQALGYAASAPAARKRKLAPLGQ